MFPVVSRHNLILSAKSFYDLGIFISVFKWEDWHLGWMLFLSTVSGVMVPLWIHFLGEECRRQYNALESCWLGNWAHALWTQTDPGLRYSPTQEPGMSYLSFWASLVAQTVKCLPTCGMSGFNPWVGKIPWRRKWQPTPVFLPGKSHGRRSLMGYKPWGHKELDTIERLPFYVLSFSFLLCKMRVKNQFYLVVHLRVKWNHVHTVCGA